MKNKSFDKMTAAEKRVAIAKDAIKQIEAENYVVDAMSGYASVRNVGAINQESLLLNPKCNVCAAGACALSAMRLGNKFSFPGRYVGETQSFSVIEEWFGDGQAQLIEDAFEGWMIAGNSATLAFYDKFKPAPNRALAIFRNIIKNRGTFKP